MATRNVNVNWIMHPGQYIEEELQARGWKQRDLAFILKVPEQAVNMILSGKRGISADMAKALGAAFDVDPRFFTNLQSDYDLAKAREPHPDINVLGRVHINYPIREMINRGWLETADAVIIEEQLARFFQVKDPRDIPYLEHVAKKSSYEERENPVPPAQLAWLFRVKHLALANAVPKFSEKALREALPKLEELMINPEDVRHVPRILMDCGVRYAVVEKLPNSKIDGVCFWLDRNSPVIGMSTQRDTIDNFWFVLRHEIEHVLQRHGQERQKEMIDTDVQGEQERGGLPEEERIANAAAATFCVPAERLDSFMRRKHPFYYERDVLAFSRLMNRHPGIIIGQMQRRLDNYKYLARYLSKIRQFVLAGSPISDGWGQVVRISL
jgi:HTH-type transcriptional regulator / antitoxin HigA